MMEKGEARRRGADKRISTWHRFLCQVELVVRRLETRKRATRNYKRRHPEKVRHLNYLSYARMFIIKMASNEELDMLQKLMDARREANNQADAK